MQRMRRLFCFGFALTLPSVTLGEVVQVPFGTTVFCELAQEVVSKKKDFAEGDIVRAHTWKDVRVNGRVVIEAGTPVFARISELTKARIAGRKGQLEIEVLNVVAVDGSDVPLEGGYDKSGKGKVGVSVALAALVAWPLIFLKGKKAVLPAGTVFDSIVRSPAEVEVVEVSAGPALQVIPDLTVEILYDDIEVEGKGVRELPLKIESSVGAVSEASVVSVNGKLVPAVPIRLTTDAGDTVTGVVDFKALSKHFGKGMNTLGVKAGQGAAAEVLVEIEL